MSKVVLLLPGNKTLALPKIDSNLLHSGKLALTFRALRWLAVLAITALLVCFGLISRDLLSPEIGYVNALFILVSFLLVVFLGTLVLAGMRQVIDPPMFMEVLIFALAAISVSLLVSLTAGSNTSATLGTGGVRFLASVVVMALLGLFYFLVYFTSRRRILNLFVHALLLGLVLTNVLALFVRANLFELLPITIISIPVLVIASVRLRHWLFSLVSFLGAVVGIFLVLQPIASQILPASVFWPKWAVGNPALAAQWFLLILVSVAASAVMALLWLRQRNWKLSEALADTKKAWRLFRVGKINFKQLIDHSAAKLVVLFLGAWFVLGIGWAVINKVNVPEYASDFAIDYRLSIVGKSAGEILIGEGFGLSQTREGLANIFNVQGLVGVAAYFFLWISAILLLMKVMRLEAKEKVFGLSLSLILGPIVFFVPLVSIFVNLALPMVILWWVSVALLASRLDLALKLAQSRFLVKLLGRLEVRKRDLSRFLPWLQIAVVIVLLVAWVLFIRTGNTVV